MKSDEENFVDPLSLGVHVMDQDLGVSIITGILEPGFGPKWAEERARNIVGALAMGDLVSSWVIIADGLKLLRSVDRGSYNLSDGEIDILTTEILEKTAHLKLF